VIEIVGRHRVAPPEGQLLGPPAMAPRKPPFMAANSGGFWASGLDKWGSQRRFHGGGARRSVRRTLGSSEAAARRLRCRDGAGRKTRREGCDATTAAARDSAGMTATSKPTPNCGVFDQVPKNLLAFSMRIARLIFGLLSLWSGSDQERARGARCVPNSSCNSAASNLLLKGAGYGRRCTGRCVSGT